MKTEYLSFQIDAKGIIYLPLLSASNLHNHIIHSSVQHCGSKQRFGAKCLTGKRIITAQSSFHQPSSTGTLEDWMLHGLELKPKHKPISSIPTAELDFSEEAMPEHEHHFCSFILATLPSSLTVFSAPGSSVCNGTDVSGWCQGIIQMKDFPCKSSREDRCLIWPELNEDCHQTSASAALGL